MSAASTSLSDSTAKPFRLQTKPATNKHQHTTLHPKNASMGDGRKCRWREIWEVDRANKGRKGIRRQGRCGWTEGRTWDQRNAIGREV